MHIYTQACRLPPVHILEKKVGGQTAEVLQSARCICTNKHVHCVWLMLYSRWTSGIEVVMHIMERQLRY